MHTRWPDDWLREGGLALRKEVADDLAALTRGARGPVETAQRWAGGDDLAQRLRHAADLALAEAARCGAAADGLTSARRIRTLATWFDAANRTRDLLRTTVRADLAVVELLAQWRGASSTPAGQRASTGQHPRDQT